MSTDGGGGAPPTAAPQYIEVPVKRESTKASFSLGNLLLIGGLGYLALKTFLLEERLNDLTVLVKRQGGVVHPPSSVVTKQGEDDGEDDAYETSEGEFDETDGDEEEDVGATPTEDEASRIEEIPRVEEVPTPSASAFVNTRQRRVGSESRRGDRHGKATQ